jgi:hypothetical protein
VAKLFDLRHSCPNREEKTLVYGDCTQRKCSVIVLSILSRTGLSGESRCFSPLGVFHELRVRSSSRTIAADGMNTVAASGILRIRAGIPSSILLQNRQQLLPGHVFITQGRQSQRFSSQRQNRVTVRSAAGSPSSTASSPSIS